MAQHVNGLFHGFTKTNGIRHLVYHAMHDDMDAAIKREKLLKRWHRAWKYRLIEQMNPEWRDLYDAARKEILDGPEDIAR